jgi:hypothetical protein
VGTDLKSEPKCPKDGLSSKDVDKSEGIWEGKLKRMKKSDGDRKM